MNTKIKFLILLFFICYCMHSQELNRRIIEDKFSESMKVNPEADKALVIVHSEVQNLRFESNRKIDKVKQISSGDWEVWLPYGTHILKLDAEGFQRLELPARNYAAKRTYEIWLKATGFAPMSRADENLFDVVFILNQDSVYSSYGTFAPTISRGNQFSYRLPKGDYRFLFQKFGYTDLVRELNVQENIRDSLFLVSGQSTQKKKMEYPGILAISSVPAGAEVIINGQKVGTTPYQGEIVPGSHQLELRKLFHYADVSSFTIGEGKTQQLSRQLTLHAGYLTVQCATPNATVYLNDKSIGKAPFEKKMVESGKYTMKIDAQNYRAYSEEIELKDGENKSVTAVLKPAFGNFEVYTMPEAGADVYIDEVLVGRTPYVNKTMQSGRYQIRVSKNLYADIEEFVEITDGGNVSKKFTLQSSSSELFITAKNCDIFLNEKLIGRDEVNRKLNPGKYVIRATRGKNYIDAQQEVFLSTWDKKTLTLIPEPRMGSISVFVEPMEAAGSEIYIGGEQRGIAPANIPIIMGSHLVTLKKPSYLDITQKVDVEEGKSSKITFTMKTYEGSRKEVSDRWGRYKWYSLGLSTLAASAGAYFRVTANMNTDKYNTANTAAVVADLRKKIEDQRKLRDISFQVSAGFLVGSALSWFIQAVY